MKYLVLIVVMLSSSAIAQPADCTAIRIQMQNPIRWLFPDWREFAALCGLERPSRRTSRVLIDSGPVATPVAVPGKRLGQQLSKPGVRRGQL